MDVVILAAGQGRRFGGAKQFTPVTADGRLLLELTAADARRAGCQRAVIVTSLAGEEEVRAAFAARPIAGLAVEVVLQRGDDLPIPVEISGDKPWGTAHAVWAARRNVRGSFLLFNADDYYGPNAPRLLAAALAAGGASNRFALLSYPLGTTLSAAGTVSRALCEIDGHGYLTSLREVPAIDSTGHIVVGEQVGQLVSSSTPVSMNAWGLTPAVFPLIDEALRDFLESADLERDECHLPTVIDKGLQAGEIHVQVVHAPDRWCGMTWPEDRVRVARHLAEIDAAQAAAREFGLELSNRAPVPHGSGLIHSTWRVGSRRGAWLLQRINRKVFPDPVAVARNAAAAARRVDQALARCGDLDPRHRVSFVDGPRGEPWLRDREGEVWRCTLEIPDARGPDPARSAEVLAAARVLGRFPGLVAEGPGPELVELLPGFHDTPARFAAFRAALAADAFGRGPACARECDRLQELEELTRRLPPGCLPTRLIHNDAKLDNVLVDLTTGEALCVIDLDTVMPGIAPHDFGDLVRAAVTGRPEDEVDLDRIRVRHDVFRDLASGYVEGASGWLSPEERWRLVDGALVITFEQTVRFLSDHLAGDIYYRVEDREHNLRRARAQLHLLDRLLESESELRRVVVSV